jgi:hypothetical protein
MNTLLRAWPLAGLLALLLALASPAPSEAAPDGHWELTRVELVKPPLQRDTLTLSPSTRSGAFVVRASFVDRNTRKPVDDWTAAWRWTPMPKALIPGREFTFELTQTIVHQPKQDIGHQRCVSGGRIQTPTGNDWPEGGILRSADGKDGLFHMSRWEEQKPQSFKPRVTPPEGREGKKFAIAIIIWHTGGLPAWIWRHVYEWRGGSVPQGRAAQTVPPAQEWRPGREDDLQRRQEQERLERQRQERGPDEATSTKPSPGQSRTRGESSASGMTLEADRRTVEAGGTVAVPVWLRNGRDLGNLNFEIVYDPTVVRPRGKAVRGNLLGGTPFESNPAERGLMRIGFASSGSVGGDGTIAQVRWEAVGRAGQRSPLRLKVTRADADSGGRVEIATIDGEVEILTADGRIPGDANGNKRLDAGDALNALKMSVKLIPEDLVCDLDGDRTVTSNDARLILEAAARRP